MQPSLPNRPEDNKFLSDPAFLYDILYYERGKSFGDFSNII
eukprot:SAG11_NODE_9782_length_881_cov_0.979540_1_plen_40_part_10